MFWRKAFRVIRFLIGFSLWPVVLTMSVGFTLDVVLARLGANPDGPAKIMLALVVGSSGLILPGLAVLFFGVPYVLVMHEQKKLGFRAVMIPTLLFAVVQPASVYLDLCDMHPPHPLAEAVALPQAPVVIACGLLFYFIAVWKPGGNRA
ncbi:MAG: hypothetical protein ABFE01_11060 [Phycisphaerales bacterium]